MKIGKQEISLSETFKRIYDNKDEINKKIENQIKQWEKEDHESDKKG